MKKIRYTAAAMALVLLLGGCTRSTIISPTAAEDVPVVSSDGIAWDQLWQDFDEIYSDVDIYPYAETVNCSVFDDENVIRFYILLNQVISPEEAAEYATTVIKGFNDLIAEQNPDYARSSDSSYGGYVSTYDIYVMVANDDTKSDRDTWILEDTIPEGTYHTVDPYGEEQL